MVLSKPGAVRIDGRVYFDPARDDVKRLEVIEGGRVLRSFLRQGDAPDIRCQFDAELREPAWLALRASGSKVGPESERASLAHSAAVYVVIERSRRLADHPTAKALARAWAVRLKELKRRLGSQIDHVGRSRKGLDEVDGDYLRKNRDELIEAIRRAKKHFLDQAR